MFYIFIPIILNFALKQYLWALIIIIRFDIIILFYKDVLVRIVVFL